MTQDQATAFDPFKGFGPKIKIRKTGDHGQRNDQRARPVHEVPGDQHRPGAEERERGDGAGLAGGNQAGFAVAVFRDLLLQAGCSPLQLRLIGGEIIGERGVLRLQGNLISLEL